MPTRSRACGFHLGFGLGSALAQDDVEPVGEPVKLDGAQCHDDRRELVGVEHQVDLGGRNIWLV